MTVRLGAHMSISGGVDTAFDRAEQVGCDSLQIFTKSSNQWRAAPLTAESIERYHQRQAETGIHPVVAHTSYLLNMASPNDDLWQKTVDSLIVEMERCEALGISNLVIHPGSHVGSGDAQGLARIVSTIDTVYRRLPAAGVRITLETTSGQGNDLGYRFEQLAEIIGRVEDSGRLAVCFDTCHTLAAGYDFRSDEGYRQVFDEFDRVIGLPCLAVFHLNDSTKDVGSRRDRHAHIGEGFVGLEGFRRILNDPRFREVPMLIETPKSADMHEDVENLRRLRDLIAC
jgi:deoxyribonuclease-4